MGLLTIIKKVRQQEKQLRILILGLDNAGKTTILKRINGDEIQDIEPTLGFNIQTIKYEDYQLNFWDVGGQTSIRSYWRNYFEMTDGVIWVVDSADRSDRLDICKAELHSLLKEERLAGATLMIYANKQDLEKSLSLDEIAERLALKDIKTHHWHIEACSAVTGEHISDGIQWLVKDMSSRLFSLN